LFLYDFTANSQAGTFWYHSHLYDVDDGLCSFLLTIEQINILFTCAKFICCPGITFLPKEIQFPTFDSTLINGAGRYPKGPSTELTSITVKRGKRYRFRLVSIFCGPNFTFSIDGHNLTIIEVDGINTEPLVVNEIQIFVGQRYSFILNANQPVDNYWIRSFPNLLGDSGIEGGLNSGILRYVGSNATADPTTTQANDIIPLVESNLVPLSNPAAPGTPEVGGAEVLLNLNLGFDKTNSTTGFFTINNVTFVPPSVPVLLQILSDNIAATDLLPKGSVYPLPPNKVVEPSIPAGLAGGLLLHFLNSDGLIHIAPIPFGRSKQPNIATYLVAR
jgi:iron transport multicopper oxidase